jgi:hypothetical protein
MEGSSVQFVLLGWFARLAEGCDVCGGRLIERPRMRCTECLGMLARL